MEFDENTKGHIILLQSGKIISKIYQDLQLYILFMKIMKVRFLGGSRIRGF
jgi:hypothetical protein